MHIKAMVIFQGGTNKPEDRFVNTFHFDNPTTDLEAYKSTLDGNLAAIWNLPTGDNLGKAMPAFVSRAVETRYYDMAQLQPRVPAIGGFTLGTPIVASSLPEEVAVTGTFYGAPPITPSRRGRVFFGPLSNYAMDGGTATLPVRVNAAYRGLVVARLKQLCDDNIGWSVYSVKNNLLVPVVGGYCDDAFDTIRKRGPDTTARSTWTKAVV